ncbi:unnamed protein product [Colias eurytheme]|nr:unnamed protein product [Colias eurytheme]
MLRCETRHACVRAEDWGGTDLNSNLRCARAQGRAGSRVPTGWLASVVAVFMRVFADSGHPLYLNCYKLSPLTREKWKICNRTTSTVPQLSYLCVNIANGSVMGIALAPARYITYPTGRSSRARPDSTKDQRVILRLFVARRLGEAFFKIEWNRLPVNRWLLWGYLMCVGLLFVARYNNVRFQFTMRCVVTQLSGPSAWVHTIDVDDVGQMPR